MNKYTLVFLLTVCMALFSGMKGHKPLKIIFFGDSITARGTAKGGYITLMDSLIKEKGLAADFDLLGAGVSGNKVSDLYLRLTGDVLDKKPDVVVILIGINDVWHKSQNQCGTEPGKFDAFYAAMIKSFRQQHIRCILCTPPLIGEKTDCSNPQDGDLNYYAVLIRELAQRFNCPVSDLRKEFLVYNKMHNIKNQESGI